jgi:glyoxylate reductase
MITKARVFVTSRIPDEGVNLLRKRKNVTVDLFTGSERIPRKELLKRVHGATVILPKLTEKIDAEVMDAAGPQLKLIANYAVGFDNIDITEAKQRGISVSNASAPGVSEAVAEHAVALIFALAHRVVEADAFTRAGKYKGWGAGMFMGTDVMGKTLGIIGCGAIGMALVRRMHGGFGARIIYTDVRRNPDIEKNFGAKFRTKMELLKESDVVSLHVPLLPSTRHLISTAELKAMKKTAFLINTARGPVVDELALVKALTRGDIAGAGLDVFECEPLIDCNPRDTYELRKLPNVVLTPHIASATTGARVAMSIVAAQNILAFVDGKPLPNLVK